MAQSRMSTPVSSVRSTSTAELDRAVGELSDHAAGFARVGARQRARLVRHCLPLALEVAAEWSAAGLRVKGLPGDSIEEWLSGPVPLIRHLRLLAASLDDVALRGRPPLGVSTRQRDDGRLEVNLFPAVGLDRALYRGFTALVLLQEGVGRQAAVEAQAAYYQQRDPVGSVALVLGAGNVTSIGATDVLTKMFNEGSVCLLKMNPVNEWVGPFLARALEPLITAGYLRVVYGGAEVGAYLAGHEGIDAVHLTGSAATHDAMVWGPPGPESDRRRAANDPVLTVPITSELGNVTPVAVVPHHYSDEQLAFQARNVATMVANNASFNCVAAKMIITGTGWAQREAFLELVADSLSALPTRNAYYPGAVDRFHALTEGRAGVRALGRPAAGQLPWALIPGLDARATDDPLFRVEPFCSLISETSVGGSDPVEFLAAATSFMNDTLWGTLSACIVIHPELERDPAVAAALDRAVLELRYGTVAINHWTAFGYALVSPPWGGHPSTSLQDIQSGLGWVHNTSMLGGVDKVVVRGDLLTRPDPAWFAGRVGLGRVGPRLAALEAAPSWAKLPGLLLGTMLPARPGHGEPEPAKEAG